MRARPARSAGIRIAHAALPKAVMETLARKVFKRWLFGDE
jgi:hypothetical protein